LGLPAVSHKHSPFHESKTRLPPIGYPSSMMSYKEAEHVAGMLKTAALAV